MPCKKLFTIDGCYLFCQFRAFDCIFRKCSRCDKVSVKSLLFLNDAFELLDLGTSNMIRLSISFTLNEEDSRRVINPAIEPVIL